MKTALKTLTYIAFAGIVISLIMMRLYRINEYYIMLSFGLFFISTSLFTLKFKHSVKLLGKEYDVETNPLMYKMMTFFLLFLGSFTFIAAILRMLRPDKQ